MQQTCHGITPGYKPTFHFPYFSIIFPLHGRNDNILISTVSSPSSSTDNHILCFTSIHNMDILELLFHFSVISIVRSDFFEYQNKTVFKENIFMKIPSLPITSCYGKCKDNSRCTNFAFLKTPVLGGTYTCYLLSFNLNRLNSNRMHLIVAEPVCSFFVFVFLCIYISSCVYCLYPSNINGMTTYWNPL